MIHTCKIFRSHPQIPNNGHSSPLSDCYIDGTFGGKIAFSMGYGNWPVCLSVCVSVTELAAIIYLFVSLKSGDIRFHNGVSNTLFTFH